MTPGLDVAPRGPGSTPSPRWLIALLLCTWLCVWLGDAAAAVSARFDRDDVHEGETLTLLIESDSLGGDSPDLSVLNDGFEVRGTSTGTQIQIVNGRRSATRSWRVVLTPKRTGVIEVPAIRVGDETTEPLRLVVSEAPQGAVGDAGDQVFMELEVGDAGAPVYVQQQVPVVVRLFTALPLRTGELTGPRAEGAVVERLGEDVLYNTTRDGKEYRVVERRFSLSPERSGELRIPPIKFNGELRLSGRRGRMSELFRDPIFEGFASGMFAQGEPVRAQTEATTLDVLPQPEGFDGQYWLPALDLSIEDSWEREPPSFRDGEPAERRLTIRAKGLSGPQLPRLEMPASNGARVYAESPEVQTRTDGKALFGVSLQRATIMPSRAGELRFPEIRLRWWDVAAGRERVAVVPERRFDAAGAPVAADGESARGGPGDRDAPASADDTQEPIDERLSDPKRPVGVLLTLAGLVLLWLLWTWRRALLRIPRLRLVRRRRPQSPGEAPDAADAAPRADAPRTPGDSASLLSGLKRRKRSDGPLAQLRSAAERSDVQAATRAMLRLARVEWPEASPSSLGEIAERLEATGTGPGRDAAIAVRELDAAMYGPEPDGWNGRPLAESVTLALAEAQAGNAQTQAETATLPPLYPDRT